MPSERRGQSAERRVSFSLRSALCALPCLLSCGDPTLAESTLEVTPSTVTCTAGDAVRIAATTKGVRAAAFAFGVDGDAVWLDDVQRDRGSATILCRAVGTALVTIEGAGRSFPVPVRVLAPPASTLRIAMAPAILNLITGTTAYVDAHVDASRAGVSTDVRYRSSDTTIAAVDSIFGLVRATSAGATSIVAAARADPNVIAAATVIVTRSSTLVQAIITDPSALTLRVGDSTRVAATVQLARTAPPGTSAAVAFSSSDESIVRVTPSGSVRAVGQGYATIFAAPVVAPLLRARIAVSVGVPAP